MTNVKDFSGIVELSQQVCIQQLFEAQVKRTPYAVALVFENQQLTYWELNYRANQLAHHLQDLGVGPEVLVGICVERSIEMVVGLLAVLKAGGAYMPLDPAYPKDRLAYMLADTQVKVLLVQTHLLEMMPEHGAHIVNINSSWEWLAQEKTENAISEVTPENLIAVIYTSGSTGQPKGVMLKQASYTSLCLWYQNYCNITEISKALLGYSFSFDASFRNIVTPLLVGGQLILTKSFDPLEWLRAIEENKVTMLATTPSLFVQVVYLAATSNYQSLSSLQELSFGGEPLVLTKIKSWLKSNFCNCNITNVYGTTESADVSVAYVIKREELNTIDDLDKVPIGKPIENYVKVYILDENQNLKTQGLAGELCITHMGGLLAKGYLNKPELTAEKFVQNPWITGEKVYKTGDLGRWFPDGNLECLGRIDHQVKLRGLRIEIGEIEAVLREYAAVLEAVVILREDVANEKMLVAYLVPKQQVSVSVNELYSFLSQKLPAYMMPSAFVILEKLPLTPNGKIDRQALPMPDKGRPQLEVPYVAPRNTLELQITQIWEDILDTFPIGVTDHFFDVGGDSFLAVLLMGQIRQQFGQELQLSTLFEVATVEHQASILRQQTISPHYSPLVKIQPNGSKWPFFCVHPAGGNVLCYVDLARQLAPDQPVYGLQSLGFEREQEPCCKIEDMATEYIKAIRAVQPQGPYLLGGWSMGGIVAFEMAQQLQAQAQKVNLLALIDIAATTYMELTQEDDTTLLISFVQDMGLSLDCLNVSLDRLLLLESQEQLAHILKQAKMANLLSPDVELPQICHLFHIFKSNARAIGSYRPQPYAGRVTLFKAQEQSIQNLQDQTMGWGELATEGVDINTVFGSHYTLIRKLHVQALTKQLKVHLDKVQSIC